MSLKNNIILLSIIIPIRAIVTRNIDTRLTYCISDNNLNISNIEFIIVDDGSPKQDRDTHEAICKVHNLKYIYIDSIDKPVNMSRARNIGVTKAIGKYIMFMDVDLYPYPGFYSDVLQEMKVQELDKHQDDLIMFSVIYLTKEKGNELFFKTKEEDRKSLFLQKLVENDTSVIEKFSTGTSVALYHKSRYIELGGYDEDFYEWGYEDLEFNLRMMCASKKFPIPDDFHLDYKTFQTIDEYRGWKSLYKRYGEITFDSAIVLFHIWHEINYDSNYIKGYEKNRQKFIEKISNLCLDTKASGKKDSLFIRYKNSTLITFMQQVKNIPLLGTLLLYIKQKIFQWK